MLNPERPLRRAVSVAVCVLLAACVSAQTPSPDASGSKAFDGNRGFEHLKQLVAIGPRPAGSPGAQQTRDYVKRQMQALGIATTEHAFEAQTPIGPLKMVNVSATIPGPGTGRLIIAGHYDTKLFKEFTFVGANDAGSSTAFLIELARVLKDRKNALTIELLFLDGEEAIGEWETGNTHGSRHYVAAAEKAGTLKDIKAMILVDMIADKDLVIKRDSNSTPWLTDAVWSAARQMKQPEFVSETTTVKDDHLSFLAAGIPAVDIIDLEYPNLSSASYWHTAEDTLDKVSAHSMQVVGEVLLAALPAIELRIR